MDVRELSIANAFLITPTIHVDSRGEFLEWYRHDRLAEALGHSLDLRQANTSVSEAGVVRGIHFADIPPGQAKYVTCMSGSILDFVIDIRVGSPTFGTWQSIPLDDSSRNAVYLSEGLGHAFLALEDHTVVSYLVSDTYNPSGEHGITPLDPALGLDFGGFAGELKLSPKDGEAPTLEEALASGLLPRHDECLEFYATVRARQDR